MKFRIPVRYRLHSLPMTVGTRSGSSLNRSVTPSSHANMTMELSWSNAAWSYPSMVIAALVPSRSRRYDGSKSTMALQSFSISQAVARNALWSNVQVSLALRTSASSSW